MKKIGCFKKQGQEFIGTVTWLQSDIRARIAPVQHKLSPQAPDYLIYKIGSDNFMAELGGGWQKHSPEEGIPYLDLTLDNPALQQSVNVVLSEGSDGLWYLYWARAGTAGDMIQTLYAQEELKPQLGIRPIAKITLNLLRFYPELVAG